MAGEPGFITLEGVEGSGKSTQLYLLARAFEAVGIRHLVTREPGGTDLAERLRDLVLADDGTQVDPKCELFIYLAARHDHVANRVRPALTSGKWVLCDRFADATVAYQGYGRGMEVSEIDTLAWWGHGARPELTLLLDLPVDVGLDRVVSRGELNRLDREAISFHRRVQKGYRELAAAEPRRITTIDASGDVATVHQAVVDAVKARFGKRLPDGFAPCAEIKA
jgi:dTMP kinase